MGRGDEDMCKVSYDGVGLWLSAFRSYIIDRYVLV